MIQAWSTNRTFYFINIDIVFIYLCIYLNQAEDNLIDFPLWTNRSANVGKTKSFQSFDIFSLILASIYYIISIWKCLSRIFLNEIQQNNEKTKLIQNAQPK